MIDEIRTFVRTISILIRWKLGLTSRVKCPVCEEELFIDNLVKPYDSRDERMCPSCALSSLSDTIDSIIDYATGEKVEKSNENLA